MYISYNTGMTANNKSGDQTAGMCILHDLLHCLFENNKISFYMDCIGNKSATGLQHTPPRDSFNAKKIILKLNLFNKEMPKIESDKTISNVNQGP